LHDKVDVPEPVTLFGVSVQVKPVAGLMLDVRLTNPLKLWSAEIVMVEVPEVPPLTLIEVGLAVIVKSWIAYATVAE
jgi:hypothetical protein